MFTSFSTALSALSAHVDRHRRGREQPGQPEYAGIQDQRGLVSRPGDAIARAPASAIPRWDSAWARRSLCDEFTQGAIQTTGGTLDAAIQGDGFFVIQGPNQSIEYTRGGNFEVDKDGNLTTATGEQLQGWTQIVNGLLNTNATPGNITIPVGTVQPPSPTAEYFFRSSI